ncbi:MAG TPA: hypothetical protein VHQ90_25265 [Thermoanaerobaculia bacterium]|nr:hypothetical protein [Thermoanaerobaculia bacterium]
MRLLGPAVVLLLGGATAGADSLFTLTPCRVVDTRATQTPLTGSQLFTLIEGTCGVPIWATAVAANVTLINPTANASLGLAPGDQAASGTNVVSVAAGGVRAGFAVLPLATDQSGTVLAFPTFATAGAKTDLAIDVSAYFAPDNAGAPVEGQGQMYSQGGDGDPGGATDPRLDPRPNTLGQPQLPSNTNPARLGGPGRPAAAAGIIPIGMDRVTHRYFVDHGAIKVLIGVSSDIGCHLHLTSDGSQCSFDSSQSSWYVNVLRDAASKGLNKMRLLVTRNGGDWQSKETCAALEGAFHDQPFRYHQDKTGKHGIGYWYLDQQNIQFFKNLKAVVEFAKQQGIYVEVTFFGPWVGIFELGPWHPDHARLSTDLTTPIGFNDRSYFAKLDPSNGGVNVNEAMRAYQMQVMHWTVDTLWSYDNVYWEIANEPEKYIPESTGCGAPTTATALAADVAQWQNMMIDDLAAYEQNNYVSTGLLAHPHLIAVQPFSPEGANIYAANGNVDVINGHYTTVRPKNGGLGAIDLARGYANQPKILGFNEGKITGLNADGSTNKDGTANGGQADSARAEAWEFMVDQGGTFDHFGYYYSSANGRQIRQQLGALKSFLSSLALRHLTTSPDVADRSRPGARWVNIGPSPYNPVTPPDNTKFWAALEPSSTATIIQYVLYIHHSQPRHMDENPAEPYLAFGGYQPLFGSYQESLRLCLGPQPGTFAAQWIDPSTNMPIGSAQTIPWAGSTTCGNGGPGSVTVTTSQSYSYDIALLVTKQ